MKTKTEKNQMNHPRVASRAEWLAARLKLLKAEKIGTKQGAFFAADSATPTNKDRLSSLRLGQTHRREQSPVNRTINRQTVAALEGADCTPRAAADHAIDRARVISSGCESALHLHNQ